MSQSVTGAAGFVPRTWKIDPDRSEVRFAVRVLGLITVRGTARRVTGTVTVGSDTGSSSVEAVVDLTTVETRLAPQGEAIRSAKLLDVARYPTADYQSTKVRKSGDSYLVDGQLTFLGITAAVPLRVQASAVNERPAFTAQAELVRPTFGFVLHEGPGFMDRIIGSRVAIEVRMEVSE